jgi:hypothetical protein
MQESGPLGTLDYEVLTVGLSFPSSAKFWIAFAVVVGVGAVMMIAHRVNRPEQMTRQLPPIMRLAMGLAFVFLAGNGFVHGDTAKIRQVSKENSPIWSGVFTAFFLLAGVGMIASSVADLRHRPRAPRSAPESIAANGTTSGRETQSPE